MGVFIISPTDKGGLLQRPSARLVDLSGPFPPMALNQRWLLQDPRVHTLSMGASTPEEFAAPIAIADQDGPLTDEEAARIGAWDHQWATLGTDLCAQCYECLPCPERIHIPEVLRLRNAAVAFEMVEYGRYRYNMMSPENQWAPGALATACTRCGDCLPRCPEGLDIPALLADAHDRLTGEKGRRLWSES
jgi:predicted aldo/keto reductase-like oxidoreductase